MTNNNATNEDAITTALRNKRSALEYSRDDLIDRQVKAQGSNLVNINNRIDDIRHELKNINDALAIILSTHSFNYPGDDEINKLSRLLDILEADIKASATLVDILNSAHAVIKALPASQVTQ